MANVSFHLGTSEPGKSGLTAGGIYVNSSAGGIYYASSATARSEIASKVLVTRNKTSGEQIGIITVNGTEHKLYCNGKGPITTATNQSYTITQALSAGASILWCRVTFSRGDGLYPFMPSLSQTGRTALKLYMEFPMFRMVSSTSGTSYTGSFTTTNGWAHPFICDVVYASGTWTFDSYTYDDDMGMKQKITSSSSMYQACVNSIQIYNYSKF